MRGFTTSNVGGRVLKIITAMMIFISALVFVSVVVLLFLSPSLERFVVGAVSVLMMVAILAVFFWIRSVVKSMK
jgi:hypothetical protein